MNDQIKTTANKRHYKRGEKNDYRTDFRRYRNLTWKYRKHKQCILI